jgi:hypothetical protein
MVWRAEIASGIYEDTADDAVGGVEHPANTLQ